MALAYIHLNTKQYFNFMCKTDFERRIFHDTYQEFQKRAKIYYSEESLHTFSTMCKANIKANSLHQKLQYVVMGTIANLDKQIPVLNDADGKPIKFDSADLQIYESDLLNKARHVVSIKYTSAKLVLHEIVGDLLILSYDNKDQFNETFIVKMTNDLEINYQQARKVVFN